MCQRVKHHYGKSFGLNPKGIWKELSKEYTKDFPPTSKSQNDMVWPIIDHFSKQIILSLGRRPHP